jgi:ribosomal protein S18 acetylase RimI-like enzyme
MIQLHTSDWDSKTIVDKVAADIKLSPETVQHFVAIENEKIIGNLVVKQDTIKALYVHPDFQNMGMATALLKRVDASKLYVATYNKQAIEFYKKRGYSVAGKSSKKYDFGTVPVYKMIINKISN